MIKKKTKILSVLMALFFLFGTLSPGIGVIVADDTNPESTEVITSDLPEETKNEDANNENQNDDNLSADIPYIVTGFECKFDEETGEQLPLFSLTANENSSYEEIGFPVSVNGYLASGESPEGKAAKIPVIEWTVTDKNYNEDGYVVCIPTFDGDAYFILENVAIPFGVIKINQIDKDEAGAGKAEAVVKSDDEIINEGEDKKSAPVADEEKKSEDVKSEEKTDEQKTDSESNTVEPVSNNDAENSAANENNAEQQDNKAIITGFYTEPGDEFSSNGYSEYGIKNIAFDLTLPTSLTPKTISLPEFTYVYVNDGTEPTKLDIVSWEIVSSDELKPISNDIIMKAVFPDEYTLSENVQPLYGILRELVNEKPDKDDEPGKPFGAKATTVTIATDTANQDAYLQVTGNNAGTSWNNLSTPYHYVSSGTTVPLYCLQHKIGAAKGSYTQVALSDINGQGVNNQITGITGNVYKGLVIILQRGYPYNSGGLSAIEARQLTQNVVRIFLRMHNVGQQGSGGTYNNAFRLGYGDAALSSATALTQAQLATRIKEHGVRAKVESKRDAYANYMASLLYPALHPSTSMFTPTLSASPNPVTLTWNAANSRFEGTATISTNTNGTVTYTTPSGFTITKSGNTLTITAGRDKANTTGATVNLASTDTRGEGSMYGYYPNERNRQALMGFIPSTLNVSASFKINVGGLPEGTLAIKKVSTNPTAVSGNSYYKLEGAKYTVYTGSNGTGTNKGTITIGSNGAGTSTLTLEPGTYYLKETTAPAGYKLNEGEYQFTISGGQDLVLSGDTGTNTTDNIFSVGVLKDSPKPYIKLYKQSSDESVTNNNSNYSLMNAVYGIYSNSACTSASEIATITINKTDSDGKAYGESTWLDYATYYVKEKTPSPGYKLDNTVYTVTLSENTPIAVKTSTEEYGTVGIKIKKSNADPTITNGNGNYSLAGAEYQIKQGNTVKAVLTTAANGESTTTAYLPYGTYTLVEITPPPGFMRNNNTYSFTVNASSASPQTLTVTDTAILSDAPYTVSINIVKSSSDTSITDGNSNYSLAGAIYKLTDSNGNETLFPATNASGIASLTGITLGTYTITEVTPPAGYNKNNATHTFTVTQESTMVAGIYTFSASNVPNGPYAESPKTGTVSITKSSTDTSATEGNANYSLAGAVYKLVGNGKTYTFPATTADGKASLSNLPLGSYVLSEVTPPPGYESNTNTYTVVISEAQLVHDLDAVDTNVLSDTPIVGSVKITKQSAVPAITNGNSCYSLEGAKYSLYRADGTLVSQKTTNADGEIVFTNLPIGNYYILETEPSQGYELNTERLDVSITSSTQEEYTGIKCLKEKPLNDPIFALVYKVDADTGERVPQGDASLAGAQFTVKYYDAFYDEVPASATPVYTWIFATDEDGFVSFAEEYKVSGPALPVNTYGDACVPLGAITIQETLAPEGYLINPTILTYKIESEGGVILAQYPNGLEIPETVKKGRFTIEKYLIDTVDGSVSAETAQASATPEVGAIFQVIDSEGIVVDTLTTGQNGKATTIELPYGTYTLHQISGTTGYVFVEDSTITISENGENRTYKYYNDRKYAALHVIKKDAETGNVIAVAGVTFEIYDSNNQKVVLDGQSSFTTDANGEFTTPKRLPYGSYTLKETIAPEGYALPTSSIPFVINDATYGTDGIVTKEAFDSKASCEIDLYKTGLICTGFETVTENGYQVTRPKFEEGFLTGVVFSLYAKIDILNNNGTVRYHAGELVMDNVTTEADGHAHFRGLQSGIYEVRETSTLNGYLLLSEPIEVICDLGDAQEIVVEPVGPIYNELKSVEMKFLKQKQIFSVSNGSGSYSYVAASGFTFGLYSGETLTLIGSGTAYTLPANTLIATAVSDSNGQVNFAGYYPAGNYYVKELEVQNDAYMLDDATYPISITMTNTAPQTVVIDNTSTPIHNDLYKANIKGVKKDAETGNVIPLAGATFEIRNSNDILVDTVVTDATGHAETSIALPYGTYSIKETVPPEGYVLDSTPNNILIDSTTVETDEAVEYVEYVANDTRIKGKITVVKKGLALTVANVEAENGFQVTKLAYTEEFLPNVKIDLYAVEDIVFLGEVKYAAGTKVTSGTTTSNGRLEFDELYLGSYELRETESASDVYVLPSQNEQVTLTSTNNTIDVVERTVNMNNVVRDVEISFVKKVPSVSTTTNGENVTTTISANHSDFIAATEGFVFGLYNSTAIEMYNNNGTIPANTLLATATIGQNGVVSFNQKLPHGTYYIKEIAFPEKYAALTGNIDGFTIIPDDLTQDLIEISLGDVYNELITVDMSIYKYDEDTEAPLGTALFEIKDNDTGVVLFRGRTNDSGMLGPVAIYPGSFTLTELEAPEDYDIAEPITFTVTPEGKVMVGETEIQNGQFNIPDEYINIPNVVLPRTGSKAALWLTICGGIAVAAGIAVFIIVGKKKKDDDEE